MEEGTTRPEKKSRGRRVSDNAETSVRMRQKANENSDKKPNDTTKKKIPVQLKRTRRQTIQIKPVAHKPTSKKKATSKQILIDSKKRKIKKKRPHLKDKKAVLNINTVQLDSESDQEVVDEMLSTFKAHEERRKALDSLQINGHPIEYTKPRKVKIVEDTVRDESPKTSVHEYIPENDKIADDHIFDNNPENVMSLPTLESYPIEEVRKGFDTAGSDNLENFLLDEMISRTKILQWRQHRMTDHKKTVQWARMDREIKKFGITNCITKRVQLPFIIRFISACRIFWETFIFISSLMTYALISYSCFFAYYNEFLWTLVVIIDLIFGFDVIMRLGIEIWRHKTLATCTVLLIPYTVYQSVFDILALIPSERIFMFLAHSETDSLSTLNSIDMIRLNRLLRIYRALKYFSVMKQERRASGQFFFIFEYMTWYAAFIHFIACVFFVMMGVTPIDNLLNIRTISQTSGWLKNNYLKPCDTGLTYQQYLFALSFSASTVTTVGYGDFFATTLEEMLVCIIVMLVGAILLDGNFISVLTSFELETDGARFDMFHRSEAIQRYLIAIKAAPIVRKKVKRYYKLLWNYRQGVYDAAMFHHLPSSMQEDILYDISQEMFHKSIFFRDLDESFLRAVARIVRVNLCNANMILCERGSYAMSMYYIIQGEVDIHSRLDRDKISCILRAGSIIGEINLFFSCPYDLSMETRTVCQFLQIRKQELMDLFIDYSEALVTTRERVLTTLKTLTKAYEYIGTPNINWAIQHDPPTAEDKQIFAEHPLELRWFTGMNPKVKRDTPDDTLCPIIAEQKCRNKSFEKPHNKCFKTCMTPPILNTEYDWVRRWNMAVIWFSIAYGFLGPYCYVFGVSSEFDTYLLYVEQLLQYPIVLVYFCDVLIEIGTACPVTGIYFKMKDGFKLRCTEFFFWIDVAAAFPHKWFDVGVGGHQTFLKVIPILIQTMKLWKVVRYLRYLENKYPKKIFLVRLATCFLVLVFGIHFIACSLFLFACPTVNGSIQCAENTWLASYQILYRHTPDPKNPILSKYLPRSTVFELASEMPYILSFFYACATLTSAGFGDFNPKTESEIVFSVFFQLIGFLIIGYYTAILTSALACIVRPMMGFHQTITAVIQFMDHSLLSENLRERVVQHYHLQYQFMNGIILPNSTRHLMYDAPQNFIDDVLLQEVELFLDGVPIFTKVDSKVMIKIAEKLQRFIVPINTTFLRRGECRRTLYIIIKGSVAVTSIKNTDIKHVIEASGHFGLSDLLYGESSAYNIRTLSDCLMWSIDWDNFQNAFMYEEDTLEWVTEERSKMGPRVEAMQQVYDSYDDTLIFEDAPIYIPSWTELPRNKHGTHERCTYEEYMKPFNKLNKINKIFWRFFLMPKTVHPVGTFAKLWKCFISIVSFCTIIFLLVEHFCWYRDPHFRVAQVILDLINYMDIYIKFHWGYFSANNVLITHPLKTSMRYMSSGSFFLDALLCIPYELLVVFAGGTNIAGYGPGATWYTCFRWTRLGQIFRLPIIFKIAQCTFKMRGTILVILYVLMTAGLCTSFAAVALYLGCPYPVKDWEEGDQYRLPWCLDDTFATAKWEDDPHVNDYLDIFLERWIVGIYYVTQVVLVVGYGDMIKLNRGELIFMIAMMVFGYVITLCIISDITAAEVDSEAMRDDFTDSMNTLLFIMKKEKVHPKLIYSVKVYFYHTWMMSKCYQPKLEFADLHFNLKADIFMEFVGKRIASVPLFQGLSTHALRALCTQFNKYYYVRAQHIIRCGNMDYDLFIITKGSVWLLDENSEYVMNLNPGQTFGEMSMLYSMPRKFSVVAATPVEVLTLSQEGYATVIECYPSIKRAFEEKLEKSHFQDIFERDVARMRRTRLMLPTDEMFEETADISRKTVYIQESINSREPPILQKEGQQEKVSLYQSVKRRLCGRGNRDNYLPFFYLASVCNSKSNNWLIHPNCGFMKLVMTIITWYCYFSTGVALYIFSFHCHGCSIIFISAFFEILMVIFIILQFFTPFQTEDMSYCKIHKEIISKYIFSPTLFFLDVLTTLPYELIEILGYFRYKYFIIIRILRLVRYYRLQLQKKNDFSMTTFRFKITLSLSSFLLMAHVLACLFYLISSCNLDKNGQPVCKEGTWTAAYVSSEEITPYHGEESWKWYIVSLYWVVSTVSTTGYGDLAPQNISEMGVGIITIFCGAFILSVIMSHFSAGFASLNKSSREFMYQISLLLKHTANIGLSKRQQDNVTAYFLMLWNGCRGKPYDQITNILPETLRIDVCYCLYHSVLSKARLFSEVGDRTFLTQVCARVAYSMYLPGVSIVTQGEYGDCLFIVFKGKVASYARNFQGRFKVTRGYTAGNIFGILPAFFYDQEYKNTYRAETVVETLRLAKKDIFQLAANYPKFSAICQVVIMEKALTKNVNLENCIFSNKNAGRRHLFELKADIQKSRNVGPVTEEERQLNLIEDLEMSAMPINSRMTRNDKPKLRKKSFSSKPFEKFLNASNK